MILSPAPQANNDDKPPRVSHELIEFLEKNFPLTAFKSCLTFDQMRCYQGAHEVIDLLKTLYDQQIGANDVLLAIDPEGA